jgi:N-acetylmuramic acid 6-phosphate etherase
MVLNMLTTGAMIRIGKTYGNLMVDLRATNAKLVARTRRIVAALTGVDEMTAERLVAEADGELKTAVVARLRNVSPAEARRLLAEADGHLRRALAGGGDHERS